jgi:hypothetical protein
MGHIEHHKAHMVTETELLWWIAIFIASVEDRIRMNKKQSVV